MSNYRVVYERDEDGSWLASVPRVPAAHTYGRTIDQARERIREALGLWVANAENATLVDDIRLPSLAKAKLSDWIKTKEEAEAANRRAQQKATTTAVGLKKALAFSYADIGTVMGVTRQRAHQIASPKSYGKKAAKKAFGYKRAANTSRKSR